MAQTRVSIAELEASAQSLRESAELFEQAVQNAKDAELEYVTLHWKVVSTHYIPGVLDTAGDLPKAVREAIAAKRTGRLTKGEMESQKAAKSAKKAGKRA